MKQKKILTFLSAAAALCVTLAACSSGSTVQTNTLPEKEAADAAQTAVRASVKLADKEIPVKAITSEQADVLCGIPAGITPETPIRTELYTDENQNLYTYDNLGRLTEYTATQPQKAAVKLSSAASAEKVVESLPEVLGDAVPHLEDFEIWQDPYGSNDPNRCVLVREIGENQKDSMEVRWNTDGSVKSIWVSYSSDTEVPLSDSVKEALRANAQAEMEARAKAQNAVDAEIVEERFFESNHKASGNFSFCFTDQGGAYWAECYSCSQPLE